MFTELLLYDRVCMSVALGDGADLVALELPGFCLLVVGMYITTSGTYIDASYEANPLDGAHSLALEATPCDGIVGCIVHPQHYFMIVLRGAAHVAGMRRYDCVLAADLRAVDRAALCGVTLAPHAAHEPPQGACDSMGPLVCERRFYREALKDASKVLVPRNLGTSIAEQHTFHATCAVRLQQFRICPALTPTMIVYNYHVQVKP